MTRPRGRPAKSPRKAKARYLQIKLEPAERDAFAAAARRMGIGLSAWARQQLQLASQRLMEDTTAAPDLSPADQDIAAGRVSRFETVDDMLQSLKRPL